MTNLTEKIDELQAQLASQHTEITGWQNVLHDRLIEIRENTAGARTAAESSANSLVAMLALQAIQLPKLTDIARDVNLDYIHQTQAQYGELQGINTKLIALGVALGLIKDDTSKLPDIRDGIYSGAITPWFEVIRSLLVATNSILTPILQELNGAKPEGSIAQVLGQLLDSTNSIQNTSVVQLPLIAAQTAQANLHLAAIEECSCDVGIAPGDPAAMCGLPGTTPTFNTNQQYDSTIYNLGTATVFDGPGKYFSFSGTQLGISKSSQFQFAGTNAIIRADPEEDVIWLVPTGTKIVMGNQDPAVDCTGVAIYGNDNAQPFALPHGACVDLGEPTALMVKAQVQMDWGGGFGIDVYVIDVGT